MKTIFKLIVCMMAFATPSVAQDMTKDGKPKYNPEGWLFCINSHTINERTDEIMSALKQFSHDRKWLTELGCSFMYENTPYVFIEKIGISSKIRAYPNGLDNPGFTIYVANRSKNQ